MVVPPSNSSLLEFRLLKAQAPSTKELLGGLQVKAADLDHQIPNAKVRARTPVPWASQDNHGIHHVDLTHLFVPANDGG